MKYTFLIISVLLAAGLCAQVDTTRELPKRIASFADRHLQGDSSVRMPRDTYKLKSTWNGIAFKNNLPYYWNGSKWEAFSGSGSTNSNVGSGYRLAIPGTNNIKTITATNGLTPDSATSNQIGLKWGGSLTANTTVSGGNSYSVLIDSANFTVRGNANSPAITNYPGAHLMFFYPKKAAFRAGISGAGSQWNDSKIGTGSVVLGIEGEASASGAVALGGGGTSSGDYSTTIGSNNTASNIYTLAAGAFSKASGYTGSAIGLYLKSKSYAGLAVGMYNDSTNATAPEDTSSLNRVFEIGNGWADTARRNAMTVLYSGRVGIGTTSPAYTLDVSGKYGIAGKQLAYLPNQTNHPNSMAYGTGLQQMVTSGSSYPGWGNTTLGISAGDSVTHGYNNTLLGALAGARLKTGFYNTYAGIAAGMSGQYATENSYFGMAVAQLNKASYNVGIGAGAMAICDSCETSVIIGAQTARVTRYMNQTVSIGYRGLNNFDSGYFNDGIGYRHLESLVRGDANVAHGNHSLSSMTGGSFNTGIGFYSGNSILTGRHNSFFGAYSGNHASQKTNAVSSTAIGAYSYNTRDYETAIGSDSTKYLRLKATDSLQADLVRTTSYGWVWAFDSATKNTRYMPTSSISGGGGSVSSAAGSGVSLVNGSSAIKRLKAGTGITITDNTDSVTITGSLTSTYVGVGNTSNALAGNDSLIRTTGATGLLQSKNNIGAITNSGNLNVGKIGSYRSDLAAGVELFSYDSDGRGILRTIGGMRLDLDPGSSFIIARKDFWVGYSGADFGNVPSFKVYKSASGTSDIFQALSSAGTVLTHIDQSGNVAINTSSAPSTYLDINGNKFRVRTAKTPSSATDTGSQGDICWDADYIYICTATNTWKRVAISTW